MPRTARRRFPVGPEEDVAAEIECINWLEEPALRADIDAVHWLESDR
jgi:hypothetical protein